jgi:tetratricopeptide (TPR) repeat protein
MEDELGAIRFRRSLKIAPGVRLSVSKTGLGLSAGVRGARYSVHSSGRRTTTFGIPGTGISHVTTVSGGRGRRSVDGSSGSRRSYEPVYATGAQAAALLPKAGFFAGAAEKRYRDGLVAYLNGNRPAAAAAFDAAIAADPKATSAHLLAAMSIDADVDLPRVVHHLETLVSVDSQFPDKLLEKFLPSASSQIGIDVSITELISARVPFDTTGATMLLAEAYQQTNRLEEAIGLIQQLNEANPRDAAIQLSLADLLLTDRDFEGVIEIAGKTTNEDDITVALIHMRAAALTALGHLTAALDSYREALAKTSNRDPVLLATIRYDRALTNEQTGRKAKARADFERLYAADPTYRDVRERLAAL